MTVHLHPETERLVQQALLGGDFRTIDEIIVRGIRARREEHHTPHAGNERQKAVELALEFARNRAVPLEGILIKHLLLEE